MYEDFVASFEDSGKRPKTWVKGGVVNPDKSCKYCKVPKFSDTRKLCCNLFKIQKRRPKLRVLHQNNANGIANSEDPDQTAPLV